MISWLNNLLKGNKAKKIAIWFTIAVSIIALVVLSTKIGVIQVFGWIYSLAFALSSLPQAIKSIQDGHSFGVADGTLILWMIGETAGLVYGFGINEYPIVFNCALNTVFVGIISYYKLRPKETK